MFEDERRFAKEVIKGLDEIKALQTLRYETLKLKGQSGISNPLAFAKETINHFYGLETPNLLIDLHFESKHMAMFVDHLINHSRGDGFKELQEVRKAAQNYHQAIDNYLKVKDNEAFQEYLKDLEGKV